MLIPQDGSISAVVAGATCSSRSASGALTR